MSLLLVFAVVLLVAVLVSERAERSVLSTAVLFLGAGFVLGPGVLDVLAIGGEGDELVGLLAELALFAVLFTDGMRVGVRDLTAAWRLPGRALLLGLPLTLVLTAVLARYVAGVPWTEAFLLGAVLAPTDPVFASAIVGRQEVPARLRHLLNVESGINDGLALPVVLVLLSALGGHAEAGSVTLVTELGLGVAIGVAVPWVALRLERTPYLAAAGNYRALVGVAIGLVVFALGQATHANLFLAAFAAGVTVETTHPSLSHDFHEFGELTAEMLKLAALLVFGALLSPTFLAEIPVSGYLFALLALLAVRPAALGAALAGSGLGRREWVAAAWFGPKGFASVVYTLLVLDAGIAASDELFHLAGLVIAASMLAHSSTDVVVARWFVTGESGELAADEAKRREVERLDAMAEAAERQGYGPS